EQPSRQEDAQARSLRQLVPTILLIERTDDRFRAAVGLALNGPRNRDPIPAIIDLQAMGPAIAGAREPDPHSRAGHDGLVVVLPPGEVGLLWSRHRLTSWPGRRSPWRASCGDRPR